jgi:hypothetical protein
MSLLTDQASQGTLGLGAAFGSLVQGPLSLPWDKGAFSTQPSPRTKIESIPENQLWTWLGDGPGPIPLLSFVSTKVTPMNGLRSLARIIPTLGSDPLGH